MNKTTLVQKLKNISSFENPSFPYEIRNLLSGKITSCKSPILNSAKQIFNDEKLDNDIRFKAFYTQQVMLWRLKEFKMFRDNLDRHLDRFKDYKLFNAFRSQYYMSKESSKFNLEQSMDYAERCAKELNQFPSVLHLYTLTIVNYIEATKEKKMKKMKIAEKLINRAIVISGENYAGHFALSARVNLLLGQYGKSNEDIRNAIEKEPSNNNEYPIRIGEYHEIKSRISNSEYVDFIKKEQEKAMELFSNLRIQMIQLLGILSAVIIFMVSAIQISQNIQDIKKASLLILIGGLVSVTVFSLFSIIFIENKLKPKSIVLAASCLILIFSIIFML